MHVHQSNERQGKTGRMWNASHMRVFRKTLSETRENLVKEEGEELTALGTHKAEAEPRAPLRYLQLSCQRPWSWSHERGPIWKDMEEGSSTEDNGKILRGDEGTAFLRKTFSPSCLPLLQPQHEAPRRLTHLEHRIVGANATPCWFSVPAGPPPRLAGGMGQSSR